MCETGKAAFGVAGDSKTIPLLGGGGKASRPKQSMERAQRKSEKEQEDRQWIDSDSKDKKKN